MTDNYQKQFRRDTDTNLNAVIPADGEPAYNLTKDRLHMGDGASYGGIPHVTFKDLQDGVFDFAVAGGTANALTVSTEKNPSALVSGQEIRFKASASNTSAATLQWGSLTATAIRKFSGGSLIALTGNEIQSGNVYKCIYDGTYWILFSAGGGGVVVSRQVFTSSGTWTKPANLLYADIEVVGGGGGGGGFGGTSGVNGATGGTSSFGTHCSATGGAGGNGQGTNSTAYPNGGGGGVGSGGDFNTYGDDGDYGLAGGAGQVYRGGAGGGSLLGGKRTVSGASNGLNANAYGGGGSGAYGGGGTGGFSYSGCGGGGAGGYSRKVVANASLGSTETVTIGAGGAGGNATSYDGGKGAGGIIIITEYRSA